MSQCYKTSNNKFINSPPLMSDGRHFTDYRPNCLLNNNLQIKSKVLNSYDYRLFLTRNAENIINMNRQHSYLINGPQECKQPFYEGTMLPEQDLQSCNVGTCNVQHNFDDGVGLGRDFKGKHECIQGLRENPLSSRENNICK